MAKLRRDTYQTNMIGLFMRLIIAENYQLGKLLSQYNLLNKDDIVVYTLGLGLWRESLVDITFQDIPFTDMSKSMRSNNNNLRPQFSHKLLQSSDLTPLLQADKGFVSGENLNDLIRILNGKLPMCSEIVVAVTQDRRGSYGAGQILDRLTCTPLPPVTSMLFHATTPSEIAKAWSNRAQYGWDSSGHQTRHKEQSIKRLFEFWWHSNSALIFGELCKHAGLKGDTVVSKYELMTIFISSRFQEGFSENDLLNIMQNWKGSGCYSKQFANLDYQAQVGSATTQVDIVNKLIERGFFSKRKDTLSISSKGSLFVNLLHTKTFDPDLPFRLEGWMINGDVESMSRYVRTLFGRQLRYQRKTKGM